MALVQINHNSATSSDTVASTWASATTANNLCVGILVCRRNNVLPTLTPPSGWTLAKNQTCDPGAGGRISISIYYIENASSRSGSETWTGQSFMGSNQIAVITAEYSGVVTSSSLDQTAGAADTSTLSVAAVSGTTGTTAQASELIIAALNSGDTISSVTNSFTVRDQANPLACNVALADFTASSTGTFTTTGTYSVASQNACAIVTFKLAPTTSIKTVDGLAVASIKTVDDLAIASVKSINGLQ